MIRFSLALGIVCGLVSCAAAAGGIQPEKLECEYLVNAAGIDARLPRLSWSSRQIQPEDRGQLQTAYQVLVATTPQQLAGDKGDLWDSGRVESDRSCEIVYAGKPLPSYQAAYWKVRVWDRRGSPRTGPRPPPGRWASSILASGRGSGSVTPSPTRSGRRIPRLGRKRLPVRSSARRWRFASRLCAPRRASPVLDTTSCVWMGAKWAIACSTRSSPATTSASCMQPTI